MFGIKKETIEITVGIEGMTCGHCSARAEKALNTLPGVKAKVFLEDKKAVLRSKTDIGDDEIRKCIEEAGYSVTEIKRV